MTSENIALRQAIFREMEYLEETRSRGLRKRLDLQSDAAYRMSLKALQVTGARFSGVECWNVGRFTIAQRQDGVVSGERNARNQNDLFCSVARETNLRDAPARMSSKVLAIGSSEHSYANTKLWKRARAKLPFAQVSEHTKCQPTAIAAVT